MVDVVWLFELLHLQRIPPGYIDHRMDVTGELATGGCHRGTNRRNVTVMLATGRTIHQVDKHHRKAGHWTDVTVVACHWLDNRVTRCQEISP